MDEKKGFRVSQRAISSGPGQDLTMEEREAREDAEMKLEAQQSSGQSSITIDDDWKPGYMNRFPWLGFGSLCVVLLCAMGSVLTLSLSNGVSQSRWPEEIAPNVIITILNSIANLAFGIAISTGIAIAWWRKTLQGSTIEQLNRSWQFSSSIKEVVLGARYFNFIALAALTTKLTIIDSTLLQKSFGTEIRADHPTTVTFTGYANTTIPTTGRVSDRQGMPALLAKNFNDDLKIWAQGAGQLPNTYAGCEGLCFLSVPGAGFEFDCSEPAAMAIDYGTQVRNASGILFDTASSCYTNDTLSATALCQEAAASSGADLFSVNFSPAYDYGYYVQGYSNEGLGYSYVNMTIMYTNATDADDGVSCPGTRYTQNCKLRPAVINYPVKIESFNSTHADVSMQLAVDPKKEDNTTFLLFNETLKQQNFFEVLEYNDVHESHSSIVDDGRTRVGGIAMGLQMYLGGNASMSFGGAAGYYVSQSGNAPTYLWNDLGTQAGDPTGKQKCGFQYINPLHTQIFAKSSASQDPAHRFDVPSIVGKINQIMFALALDISNGDDDKDMVAGSLSREATVYRDTIHYVINKSYMWGAFASIIFCILCVLPVYWGYWQLGRDVSLGPFEIAAAFRAPNLYHPTNAPVDQLIKKIGDREVKSGAIVTGDDAGKIGVAEPEHVARIHPSATPAALKRLSSMKHLKHELSAPPAN